MTLSRSISSPTINLMIVVFLKVIIHMILYRQKVLKPQMKLYSSTTHLKRMLCNYLKSIISPMNKPNKFCRTVCNVHIGTASTTPWVCAIIATMLSAAATEQLHVPTPISQIMLFSGACNVTNDSNY